jgi:hypothetical protein
MPFRQLLKSPYQYFKNWNGIFRKLKLNLRWEQWYFSNCRKGILNPYLYYALNNESCMAKFQAIICHRSFVEIKMLGLRYVAGAIPGREQWSNILIWQLFENLPKIKYFLAYVNRSIGPTIKIILSVQDNFCRTFATALLWLWSVEQ